MMFSKKIITGMIAIMLAAGVVSGCGGSGNTGNTSSSSTQSSSQAKTKQAAEKPEAKKATWNTSEVDAAKNANLQVAIEELKKNPDIASKATDIDAAAVIKTPWEYYGKVVRVTGTVGVIEPQPPTGDIGKLFGGDVYDVVVTVGADETIVEGFMMGKTKLNVGDQATLVGYPIGRMEVPNKIGGKFTHLVIVGK